LFGIGLLLTLGSRLVFDFFGFFLSPRSLLLLDSLDESLLDSLDDSLEELLLELLSFLLFLASFFSLLLPFLSFSSSLLSDDLLSLDFLSFSTDSFFTFPDSVGPPVVLMVLR